MHSTLFPCRSLFVLLLTVLIASSSAQGVAVRELPYDFHPGDLVEVRLQITPPQGTTNWSIQEFFPKQWDLVTATNASGSNELTGELSFGPFNNNQPRTLYYEVSSVPGLTNSVTFMGQVTFNGASAPTAGTTFLPSRNEWLFAGPQALFSDQSSYAVSGVAYGAGRWVASAAGWVITMEPGGRWTYPRLTRYLGENGSRLAHVGGLFLLFGANPDGIPQMIVSDDGVSWKAAQNETGSPNPFVNGGIVNAVAYGNGAWVAVGSQLFSGEPLAGAVFQSTNGYHWKRVHRLQNPSRTAQGVSFANGRFLVVAALGTLLTSTNGLNWVETRPIVGPNDSENVWTNRNLTGICHGTLGWVVPTSASGVALVSADGVNWSTNFGTPFSGEFSQSFFADGKYWFGMPGNVYSTADAVTWTRLQSLQAPQPASVIARAPDGVFPQYLANGATAGSILSSTNGVHWNVALPAGDAGWPHYLTVVALGNQWVINGQATIRSDRNGPSDRLNESPKKVWFPNFGGQSMAIRDANSQWRSGAALIVPDILVTSNRILAATVHRGGISAGFLAGTNLTMQQPNDLPDLNRLVPAQTYKGLNSTLWENGQASLVKTADGFDLFAETYSVLDGFNGQARIRWGHFTSHDGTNWTRRCAGLNHATNFPAMRGLTWGAGRFIAVSEGVSPGSGTPITTTNRIYTSTDGENYTAVDLSNLAPPLSEGLTGVTYADGKFVAIGNSGRILCSTNGLDWKTARPSDGRRWNRIRNLGNVWSVVGNAGWIAFSLDGQSWQSRTVGAESDLTDIACQYGQIMLVGSHAMVLLSQPVAPVQIVSDSVIKLPGAGLQFTTTGQAGRVLEIQTSSNLTQWTSLLVQTNTTGSALITDHTPAGEQRFYRAVQQP